MIKVPHKLKYMPFFALIVLLTGCWDFQDVNRRSITVSVGVDKINGNIVYSGANALLVPAKKSGQGGQASAQVSDVYPFSAESGRDFEDARLSYNVNMPEPDFLGAVRAVVLSQEIAREGIEPYVNRVNRLFGYRKTLPFVISRESPAELLTKNVKNYISVGFAIESTLEHLYREGIILYPRVAQVISDIALGDIGYVLPYVSKKNDSIEILGYAVIKESKMIDILSIREANGLLFLNARNPIVKETFPHPENKSNNISTNTSLKERKIRTSYSNNKIDISVRLEMNTQIQYEYFVQPITENDKKSLEATITEKIKSDVMSNIYKSQKVYKSDLFDFALYFRAQNSEIFKKIDWKKDYPDANITVDVVVKIINTNLFDPSAKPK